MTVQTKVNLSTMSYVIIYVKDTEESTKFYRDKLGMKVKAGHPGWVELETGTTTLALHGTEDGKAVPQKPKEGQTCVVFQVEDIYGTYETLKSNGVKFERTPGEVCEAEDKVGISADFHDLDGNLLSVFAYVPKNQKK